MPDLRSLEERIAEVIRDEVERETVKVCCGDFENCQAPCTPRADYWKEKAKASCVPQPGVLPDTPWPHAPSDPYHSQPTPSSDGRPKDSFLLAVETCAILVAFVFGASMSLGAFVVWRMACQ